MSPRVGFKAFCLYGGGPTGLRAPQGWTLLFAHLVALLFSRFLAGAQLQLVASLPYTFLLRGVVFALVGPLFSHLPMLGAQNTCWRTASLAAPALPAPAPCFLHRCPAFLSHLVQPALSQCPSEAAGLADPAPPALLISPFYR